MIGKKKEHRHAFCLSLSSTMSPLITLHVQPPNINWNKTLSDLYERVAKFCKNHKSASGFLLTTALLCCRMRSKEASAAQYNSTVSSLTTSLLSLLKNVNERQVALEALFRIVVAHLPVASEAELQTVLMSNLGTQLYPPALKKPPHKPCVRAYVDIFTLLAAVNAETLLAQVLIPMVSAIEPLLPEVVLVGVLSFANLMHKHAGEPEVNVLEILELGDPPMDQLQAVRRQVLASLDSSKVGMPTKGLKKMNDTLSFAFRTLDINCGYCLQTGSPMPVKDPYQFAVLRALIHASTVGVVWSSVVLRVIVSVVGRLHL
jgi:Cell morphogenesis N-terminal